jgi:hypothetical protein
MIFSSNNNNYEEAFWRAHQKQGDGDWGMSVEWKKVLI